MSDQTTLTPETDDAEMPIDRVDTAKSRPCCIVTSEFARTLERERDEWRKKAVELYAQRDKLAQTLQSLQVACFRIGRGDVSDIGAAVEKMRKKALDALAAVEGGKP